MPAENFGTEKTLAEEPIADNSTSDRWQRIETVFHQALELAQEERAKFIAARCAADAALQQEVESLLATHEAGGNLLDKAASDLAAEWSQIGQRQSQLKLDSLGHYQILSQLGKGGMGEVFLAKDTRSDRNVALKVLPAEFTNRKERLGRFALEAHAASATNHPNIITIYEIGRIDSTHFIAAEFVEGRTLRWLMNRREFDLREVLDIVIQIANALAAAHSSGIRHRDIKPENIMVRPDGVVKVLDFGLAKLAEPLTIPTDGNAVTVAEINTEPGVVLGTAQYMSPEQARSLGIDHRTDIFSLGVVLYEMVAGQAPFDGDVTIEILAAVAHREPQPLRRFAPGTPECMEQIVSRALRKNRDERYQNAAEMIADLKQFKQELELEAQKGNVYTAALRQTAAELHTTAGNRTTRIEALQTSANKAAPSKDTARHGKPRRKVVFIVLVILIVLGVIAALAGAEYFRTAQARKTDSLAVAPALNPALPLCCWAFGVTALHRNR